MSQRKKYDSKARVREHFDKEMLRTICQLDEVDFAERYGMTVVPVAQRSPNDFYFYKDNGAKVLAVAHLDTVADAEARKARFVNTEDGVVVFSRALDDRLGAYIILELLPKLGITYDILLTVGEESGESTAAFFEPPAGKEYDWMIEFDRGGTDVVMYQYDDSEVRDMVRACGAKPGDGIFSDISYLEHLGIKGFNWGVGYQDYHGPRAHAFLEDTWKMVDHYLDFHEMWEGTAMPHFPEEPASGWGRHYQPWGRSRWDTPSGWNDDWDDVEEATACAERQDWIGPHWQQPVDTIIGSPRVETLALEA